MKEQPYRTPGAPSLSDRVDELENLNRKMEAEMDSQRADIVDLKRKHQGQIYHEYRVGNAKFLAGGLAGALFAMSVADVREDASRHVDQVLACCECGSEQGGTCYDSVVSHEAELAGRMEDASFVSMEPDLREAGNFTPFTLNDNNSFSGKNWVIPMVPEERRPFVIHPKPQEVFYEIELLDRKDLLQPYHVDATMFQTLLQD